MRIYSRRALVAGKSITELQPRSKTSKGIDMDVERISRAMDYLTGKRGFYALLYVLGFLVLLPYALKGYSWHEMWDVIKEVVVYNAIIYIG